MDASLFLASIGLTVAVVSAALVYLRGITLRVLRELCGSEAGALFWMRAADLLALSGSLILVLLFGPAPGAADWVAGLRATLGLALGGLFITVLVISSSVWSNVRRLPPTEAA